MFWFVQSTTALFEMLTEMGVPAVVGVTTTTSYVINCGELLADP